MTFMAIKNIYIYLAFRKTYNGSKWISKKHSILESVGEKID